MKAHQDCIEDILALYERGNLAGACQMTGEKVKKVKATLGSALAVG